MMIGRIAGEGSLWGGCYCCRIRSWTHLVYIYCIKNYLGEGLFLLYEFWIGWTYFYRLIFYYLIVEFLLFLVE